MNSSSLRWHSICIYPHRFLHYTKITSISGYSQEYDFAENSHVFVHKKMNAAEKVMDARVRDEKADTESASGAK